MRWYVSRDGEVLGPMEGGEVMATVASSAGRVFVRDEAAAAWTPLDKSPFAAEVEPLPDAKSDSLSSGWIIALYVCAFIPYGMWFVIVASSVLYYAWRGEFPNRAKQVNRHGWFAWMLGGAASLGFWAIASR